MVELIATFLLTRIHYGLACTSGSIRLVGGTSTSEGRVEVCIVEMSITFLRDFKFGDKELSIVSELK